MNEPNQADLFGYRVVRFGVMQSVIVQNTVAHENLINCSTHRSNYTEYYIYLYKWCMQSLWVGILYIGGVCDWLLEIVGLQCAYVHAFYI